MVVVVAAATVVVVGLVPPSIEDDDGACVDNDVSRATIASAICFSCEDSPVISLVILDRNDMVRAIR